MIGDLRKSKLEKLRSEVTELMQITHKEQIISEMKSELEVL